MLDVDGTAAVDLGDVLEQGLDTATARGATVARGNSGVGRGIGSRWC